MWPQEMQQNCGITGSLAVLLAYPFAFVRGHSCFHPRLFESLHINCHVMFMYQLQYTVIYGRMQILTKIL